MARATDIRYWAYHDDYHGWVPVVRISFADQCDHHHELLPAHDEAAAWRHARHRAKRESKERGCPFRVALPEEINQ